MPVIAPIIAVAAAGWSVGAAATAGFALFETITAVSAVVGAVGVITKNKTLMTIGLVGAAVGGVGQWAQSAGAFGGTAATKAAETASGAVSKEAVSSIVKGVEASSAPVGTQVASAAAPGVLDEVTVTAAKAAAPTTLGQTTAQAVATAAAQDETKPEKTAAEKLADKRLETIETAEADARGENGYLKQFASFAKNNGQLMVLGGTTLSGLFEQPAPGSVEKTRAETELLAAQALEKKTQDANMQARLASFTPPAVPGYRGIDPTTGRQVQYATRTAADPGLINTVTGAPV